MRLVANDSLRPEANAEVYAAVTEALDTHLRFAMSADAFDVMQRIENHLDREARIAAVGNAHGQLDNAVSLRIADDFAHDMLVRHRDADLILVTENGVGQMHLFDDAADALHGDRITHDKGAGEDDVESGAIVGKQALHGEACAQRGGADGSDEGSDADAQLAHRDDASHHNHE